MSHSANFFKRTFHFGFEARTSRGQMRERDCWFLNVKDESTGIQGTGEAAPLVGLSPETKESVEAQLESIVARINAGWLTGKNFTSLATIANLFPDTFSSSVLLALETALMDLDLGGKKIIFDKFYKTIMASIEFKNFCFCQKPEKNGQIYFCQIRSDFGMENR